VKDEPLEMDPTQEPCVNCEHQRSHHLESSRPGSRGGPCMDCGCDAFRSK